MRLQLDEIIAELNALRKNTKSIRNRILLEKAISSLKEYKKLNEKKIV